MGGKTWPGCKGIAYAHVISARSLLNWSLETARAPLERRVEVFCRQSHWTAEGSFRSTTPKSW